MADQQSLEEFLALCASIEPLDPVILEMLPEATGNFYRAVPEIVPGLIENYDRKLAQSETALAKSRAEYNELQEAIQSYAIQSGEGQLFLQNLQLCLTQLRAKKQQNPPPR